MKEKILFVLNITENYTSSRPGWLSSASASVGRLDPGG